MGLKILAIILFLAMYVLMTMTLNADTIPGITYTQKLCVRWRYLKRTIVGISPPEAYIVMIQNSERLDLNKNFLRLRIYDNNAFAKSAVNVPRIVLRIVILKAIQILSLWKTVS